MEDIAISSSGAVGVRSMISHIMPQLHSSSILRGVNRAIDDVAGRPELTTTLLNGRVTKTAPVDLCCTILDKMRGHAWNKWRTSSGPAFKRDLRDRVASVTGSQVEQADPPAQRVEEQRMEEVETKAMVLRKALRVMDIDGRIRVDEPTGMVSNIDVIRMLCPEASPDYAAQMLRRVLEKESASGADDLVQDVPLADRVHYIKINGRGHVTPCSDALTIIEIIWLLPSSAARAFRKQSAETIARVLGGDVSLSDEIERRCARLQSTDEGRAFQSVMLGAEEQPAKKHKGLPEWFEYATAEQESAFISSEIAFISSEVKKSVIFSEMEVHQLCKDKMESVGQFGGRDAIEFADRIRDTQRRAASQNLLGAPAPSTSDGDQAIVLARSIDNSIDPETGLTIATHKVSASVRGPETSICAEATKLGISTGEKNGQIGKVAKRLYGMRYGEAANRNIPTRHTTFRGKPFVERTYFSRDADLIQEAIRIVCTP